MQSGSTSAYHQAKFVFFLFFLVHAIFLLAMPLFPFIDLPNHLAEATIYKYYGDASSELSHYYQPTPWYFPNTFHTVFCSLFPTVELGNRIFYVICVGLLIGSVFLVIRQLRGNAWYGLLALLFTYNYNFTYGFVGFAISIPTLILLFYFILRDFEKDTLTLKALISSTLILLFLMHAQNALLGLLLFGVMTLIQYWPRAKAILLRGVLVPLPLVVLIFVWWFNRGGEKEESTLGYLLNYYRHDYFSEWFSRLRIAVFDNFQLREGTPGVLIAASIFALVFIPLVWLRPWKNFAWRTVIRSRMLYPLIFFLTAAACYLVLPSELPGQSPLFQRIGTIVIVALIIVLSVWIGNRTSKLLALYACAAIVVYSFLWMEYIYTFNQENEGFNKTFFAGANAPSRIAGLIYRHDYRGRKVYIHFPNYYIVWNRGIAASKIIDYRFGVVRRVVDESVIPFYFEHVGDGYREIPTYKSLEYLLVRGNAPRTPDANVSNFTLIRKNGLWKLYRNNDTAHAHQKEKP